MYKGERFNSYSHLIGFIFALISSILLLNIAIDKKDIFRIMAFAVYGTMIIILYLSSTIYHSVQQGKKKDFFRLIDYLSIYLMIAGSYTPFALITLGGVWGWSIFGAVWTLAIIGIIQELAIGKRTRKYSLFIYLINISIFLLLAASTGLRTNLRESKINFLLNIVY